LAAAGQAIGGAIGTWGGRVVGGAIGTVIEPGGGTAAGAAIGGAIGGRVGGAVGSAIEDMCTNSESTDEDCPGQWRRAQNVCYEWMQELGDPSISKMRRKQLLDLTGGSMASCQMGQVSQTCGGNRVDNPPRRRR
jgi:hypothetical protein